MTDQLKYALTAHVEVRRGQRTGQDVSLGPAYCSFPAQSICVTTLDDGRYNCSGSLDVLVSALQPQCDSAAC